MMRLVVSGFAFVIGLCFGSFANVIIYRLPKKLSIVSPQSACIRCNSRLVFYELVPIISWILQRGRCRSCGEGISARLPLVEFTCAMLFACMVYSQGFSAIFLSLYGFVLLTVAAIDWDTRLIPDSMLVFASVVGVGWVICGQFLPQFSAAPGFSDAVLGILAGGLPLFLIDRLVLAIFKKDGFGYGDVKLMAVSGLFLGWQLTFVAFFFAFVSGGVFAALLVLTGRAGRGDYIAFGPFLSGGAVAAVFAGQRFIEFIFIT